MELIRTCACLIIFLQSVSSESDNDIMFDMIASRLEHISITLAKIARKQRVIETRLDSVTANMKDRDIVDGTQKDLVLDYTDEETKEELLILKKAISSEKEYVRNLVKSMPIDLGNRIAAVGATSDDLGDRIAAVEATSDDLGDRIAAVETTSEILGNRIAAVKATSDNLSRRQSTEKATTRARVDSMESKIASIVSATDRHVSFSVKYKPEDNFAILKKGTTIKFNDVIYNDGAGYNEATGIFTVPISGVYQFILFIEGWQREDDFSCTAALVYVYVDSVVITSAIAEPRQVKQNTQGGNAYINYLRKGQEVWVQTAGNCDEYSIFAFRTTFNGFLLY